MQSTETHNLPSLRPNCGAGSLDAMLTGLAQQSDELKRAAYVSRLIRLDWGFDADKLQALRELQVELDPEGELWNRHAPLHFLITRSVKVVTTKPSGERITTYLRTGMHDIDLALHFQERHGIDARVEVQTMGSNVAREVVA